MKQLLTYFAIVILSMIPGSLAGALLTQFVNLFVGMVSGVLVALMITVYYGRKVLK